MTKQEIARAYAQYDQLLHKLSHQCSDRCGRPEEDCYGQACWLFMRAVSTYKPGKCKLGTYIYAVVRNGLIEWGRKNPPVQGIGKDRFFGYTEEKTILSPDKSIMFKEWLANLSEECREVATIILNGPAEILEFGNGNFRKLTAGAIMKYLLSRGWRWPRARRTLRDLKAAVASL